MALKLALSRTGTNTTGTEMYLSDVTGIHSPENLGGWGIPNPLRSSKALIIQVIQHTTTVDNEVVVDAYDPETVENFLVRPNIDGYYEIIMVAVSKVIPNMEGSYGWTAGTGLVKFEGGVTIAKTPLELFNDPLFLDAVSYKTVLLAN